MDRLSSIITVGSLILAGVLIMIDMPWQVGIGIIILASAWALLTIPKWGPLRKYFESKPTKLFLIEYLGHTIHSRGRVGGLRGITVETGFTVTPTTLIESVQLHLKNELLPSDWHKCSIGGAPGKWMITFRVPESIKSGAYKVEIVATAEGKEHKSMSFPITLPE